MTTVLVQYPEVSTSSLRELQWSMDFWKRQYAEAGYHSDAAWRAYGDAVDNEDDRDLIEQLFLCAETLDTVKRESYRRMDEAKARYLAAMN